MYLIVTFSYFQANIILDMALNAEELWNKMGPKPVFLFSI